MHKIKDTSTTLMQPDACVPHYICFDKCVISNVASEAPEKLNFPSSVRYVSHVATSKTLRPESSVAHLMVLNSSDRFGCSNATLLHIVSVA